MGRDPKTTLGLQELYVFGFRVARALSGGKFKGQRLHTLHTLHTLDTSDTRDTLHILHTLQTLHTLHILHTLRILHTLQTVTHVSPATRLLRPLQELRVAGNSRANGCDSRPSPPGTHPKAPGFGFWFCVWSLGFRFGVWGLRRGVLGFGVWGVGVRFRV